MDPNIIMLSYTLRSLRREPALVAGVLLTFALAIGANAGMFGLVSQLMLPARWVIGGALRMVAVGCGVGPAVAPIVGPSAREMLFETSPYDGVVMFAAAGILLEVTVAAAAVPALRAARVSPTIAMRVE